MGHGAAGGELRDARSNYSLTKKKKKNPLLPPPLLLPLPLLLLLQDSRQRGQPQHRPPHPRQGTLGRQPFCRVSRRTTWATWSWGASTIHRISPSRGLGGVLLSH